MPDEKTKSAKPEKVDAVQETYLAKINKLGYPFADVAGQMVELPFEHPDSAMAAFGFRDSNGRAEIVLSATKQNWILWMENALAKLKASK
jgi:hypothetical protein